MRAKQEARLTFLKPYLVLLPGPNLNDPAKNLASLVLSAAIELKQKKESVEYLQNETGKIPSSIRLNFKLTASKNTKN